MPDEPYATCGSNYVTVPRRRGSVSECHCEVVAGACQLSRDELRCVEAGWGIRPEAMN